MAARRTTKTTKPVQPEVIEEIEDLELDDTDVEEIEEEETPKPARRKASTKKAPVKRRTAKKAPVEEEDDAEDEETDDDDESTAKATPAPAKKRAAPQRPEVEFGTQQLVDHVNETCGTEYKAYDLRVLLRKMAKSGELDREVGADRSRYSFTGVNDPVVKAVVKKVKSGAVEADKKESFDNLKSKAAAKKGAVEKAPAKKRGRPAAKPKPVDEEEYDEDDVDELD